SVAFSGTLTGADWFAERLAELDVTVVDPTDPNDDEGLPHLVRELGSDVVVVDHYGIGEVRPAVNAAGAALVSLGGGACGGRAADVVGGSGFACRAGPAGGCGVVFRGGR